MVDAGMIEVTATYLTEETEKEQKQLETKIEHHLINHYGSYCLTIGITAPRDKLEIHQILTTLQNTGFLGHRHDSLGNRNDPFSFCHIDIPTIVNNNL